MAALSAVLLAAAAAALIAVAGAAPTTDTTAVDFVTIPDKAVMSANSIPPGNTESAVVIGGATTVPSNATTVRLKVTVKGNADGTINFFPAGNEAGGAGHSLSWLATTTTTGTTAENVGTRNQVSVKNLSTKAAVVTIKITGYSTQVTAGDVNGSGGSAGEVLTNNGAGGATWEIPGQAFGTYASNIVTITFGGVVLSTLNVPAGSYVVSFDGTVVGSSATADFAHCWLFTPNFTTIVNNDAGVSASVLRSNISMQGLVTLANGGDITAFCWSQAGQPMQMQYRSLIAQRVGSVTGSVTISSGATHERALPDR